MERSVGEHLRSLEQKLNLLNAQIVNEADGSKRKELEAELRAVESALAHYRTALEIESRLS